MKRSTAALLLGCGLGLGALGCVDTVPQATPQATPEEKTQLTRANTAFALDLYGRLRAREGNLFLSPYSISTALAMTYGGARGQTAEQMARVLHFTLDAREVPRVFAAVASELTPGKHPGYQLAIANALWGQKGYPFRPEFVRMAQADFAARVQELDFQHATEEARQTINAWVEKQTQDKIKDLLPAGSLDALTRLVLTNAIYFKGDWAHPFPKPQTRDEDFHLSAAKKISVPMMHHSKEFGYLDGGDFQALDMPYAGGALSLVAFLPRKADGLAAFEQTLTADKLAGWLAKLHEQEVHVTFPRFRTTVEFQLKDTLSALGMTDAFQVGKADFSGMSEQEKLAISAVVHKAYVDINEEGTEAAAATGIGLRAAALRVTPTFRADHAFVFLIRDRRSGTLLFLGRLADPRP